MNQWPHNPLYWVLLVFVIILLLWFLGIIAVPGR
jgi:hypothetical protein